MSPASRRIRIAAGLIGALLGLAALALSPRAARADHPNALWRVIHDLCLPNKTITGFPAPCLRVDVKGGYAVLPDLLKPGHLVLAPTTRITGIEDPHLQEPGTPNYWQAAWSARDLLSQRLHRSIRPEAVGMAVNAIAGRSQEQLHIHLSCVRPDVSQHLDEEGGKLTDHWSPILLGHHWWWGMALEGSELGSRDPFKLLAAAGPAVAAHMGDQTLIVVGHRLTGGRQGFILLYRSVDLSIPADHRGQLYSGHGEYLLDETCRSA